MNNDFPHGISHCERQGDPLSAYLFIFALKVKFIEVKCNVNIAGVKIGGHSVKLSTLSSLLLTLTLFGLY